jgi:hypothetical protein
MIMGVLKGFEVKTVYDEKGNKITKDGKKEETPEPLAIQNREAKEKAEAEKNKSSK